MARHGGLACRGWRGYRRGHLGGFRRGYQRGNPPRYPLIPTRVSARVSTCGCSRRPRPLILGAQKAESRELEPGAWSLEPGGGLAAVSSVLAEIHPRRLLGNRFLVAKKRSETRASQLELATASSPARVDA